VQGCRGAGVQGCRSSGVQEFRSSGVQEFRSSGVQEFGSCRSAGVAEVQNLRRVSSGVGCADFSKKIRRRAAQGGGGSKIACWPKQAKGGEGQRLVEQLNLNKKQLGQMLLQPVQTVSPPRQISELGRSTHLAGRTTEEIWGLRRPCFSAGSNVF
jgi:hypothetical protein